MAGRVTRLQFQKLAPDRVNVYLDEVFAFALPAVDAAHLRPGQYLDEADIDRLKGRSAEQKAYERALRFVSYRPRSRAEVQRNLVEAGVSEAQAEAVMDRLVQQGFLNDTEFVRFWVENREQFKPRGIHALRQELRQKGIDDQEIAAGLVGLDGVESAYRAGQARARRLEPLLAVDPPAFRRKLSDFLARRGFNYEVIRATIARLEGELGEGTSEDV